MKAARTDIDDANTEAVQRIIAAEATLVDMVPARKAIPGFKDNLITHAGPPIAWDRMIKVQRLAVISAIRSEGLADSAEGAERLIKQGEVIIEPNHNYGNVSGMCGVTSASSPVFVFEDKVHGGRSTNWMQTDMTSFGDTYERGIKEVEFVRQTLAPVMSATIKRAGGFNVKELLSKGLVMGDELHGSFEATRGVLMNWILPHLVRTDFPKETLGKVGDYFMGQGGRWICGNLMMGGCKVMMDAARGIKHCTVVTAMARNGVDFGVKVSAFGDRWFTGPAGEIKGFLFPGFAAADGAPDIGDSAISESRGFGGTALPASPSQARLFGGELQEAVQHTRAMRKVSIAEDPLFRIPYMDFMGVPVGIDIRKVVELNTPPRIDTGIAHKDGGHGIIGTGIAVAPMEAFKKAIVAFAQEQG
ncbi:MAG TPA: DUF1116 domain-containing protein [Methanomassiliicoccales archaeon]|nr:DUF1116 domain-containing protein [Methanomassiliicoccales archaeon]